jgi:nitrous oxide reductase accessory protein NosL
MKRKIITTLLSLFLLALVVPAFAQKVDDTTMHRSCKYCGMDREKFNHSRMLIKYDDGTSIGVCSLHCAALEIATMLDKTPQSIMVADMITRQLIDAETAFWVIDSSKPGVMSSRGKWAFLKKETAETYAQEAKGKLVTFDEAIKAAFEDMYADTKMIREKRKDKKAPAAMDHKH